MATDGSVVGERAQPIGLQGPGHKEHDWSMLGHGDGPAVWVVRPSDTYTESHRDGQMGCICSNVQHWWDILPISHKI